MVGTLYKERMKDQEIIRALRIRIDTLRYESESKDKIIADLKIQLSFHTKKARK